MTPVRMICTALVGATLVAACSDQDKRDEEIKRKVFGAQYEEVDVEFNSIRHYPGGVSCGSYGTVDEKGRETSSLDFIVNDTRTDIRPSEKDYLIFCSEDSAAAFRSLTGIEWGSAEVEKAHRDIKSISEAIHAYVEDNNRDPSPRQGLATLVSESEEPPKVLHYREGGYIDEIPVDPWGREYLYQPSAFGGVASNPEIKTLGADGKKGGTGLNADISNRDLRYLEHLSRL